MCANSKKAGSDRCEIGIWGIITEQMQSIWVLPGPKTLAAAFPGQRSGIPEATILLGAASASPRNAEARRPRKP